MATELIIPGIPHDPVKRAQEFAREAERYRGLARLTIDPAARLKLELEANHYDACARRWYAQARPVMQ